MFNKNGSNNGNGNADGSTRRPSSPGQRQRAQARRRNRQRARAALGRALARRHAGARTAPRPGAGLPAQGPRRAQLRLPRRPPRHRAGQPHLRIRRLGLRAGRRRDAAPDRDGRHPDRRGEGRVSPTAPRCGSPSRALCPAPTSASTRWPRTPWTATVRRVTRHRIPDSLGRDSEGVPGSTDLPYGESQGGKQHVGKAATV